MQMIPEPFGNDSTPPTTAATGKPNQPTNQTGSFWKRLLILTVATTFGFAFSEWLFFVTKPSFMDVMDGGQKIAVFLMTSLSLFAMLAALLLLPACAALLARRAAAVRFLALAAALPAAVLLTATTLLLIDNFTYTVFKVGVVSTQGVWRGLYALLLVFLFVQWFRWGARYLRPSPTSPAGAPALQFWAAAAILAAAVLVAIPRMRIPAVQAAAGAVQAPASRPNIILLGADGLQVDHMSLYGYQRETTPTLTELAASSLVAQNAFTNAGNSTGSTISILTSKLPIHTRVSYPPDILTGTNSYQHLPGVLKNMGYLTVQISVPHYIDARAQNMLNGFDVVNNETLQGGSLVERFRWLPSEEAAYFLPVIVQRVVDRVGHVFFLKPMINPILEVTADQATLTDHERVLAMLDVLQQADQPVFIHAHFMETHGPRFAPKNAFYSAGKTQDEEWMDDFYDDTILEFDASVAAILEGLQAAGKRENTILIIYSDHTRGWDTIGRLPLILHFPGGTVQGVLHNNVQNMDIAPTILDYLGQPIPTWMEGVSLLDAANLDAGRPVFSSGVPKVTQGEDGFWIWDPSNNESPFKQFAYFQAIVCNTVYRIDLAPVSWRRGEVPDYPGGCADPALIDDESILEAMIQRLSQERFDVTSLEYILFDLKNGSASAD